MIICPQLRRGEQPTAPLTPSAEARAASMKWHIERYDRLRVSTASRAAVVLSAGALLSAGDALLIAQILTRTAPWLRSWWLLAISFVVLVSVAFVMLALLRAAAVLVNLKTSRSSLPGAARLPSGILFNATDTLAELPTFDEFRVAVRQQDHEAQAAAAEVELWVGINQHRARYHRLRQAVQLMRLASFAFVGAVGLMLAVNAANGF